MGLASGRAWTKRLWTDDPAMVTLLHMADAWRGSSTESARAILLQRGDASRGFPTESARATLLQGSDASTRSVKKNH